MKGKEMSCNHTTQVDTMPYQDYSEGHKLYVDRRDLNTATGGDPMPYWEDLSGEERHRWEERAENMNKN